MSCHNIHSEWSPVCDNCQSFDTLTWTAPPATEDASPTGVEMLPLIVGAIEDQVDEDEDELIDAEIVDDETELGNASTDDPEK